MRGKKTLSVILIHVAFAGALFHLSAVAQSPALEKILSYDSNILVHKDSTMTVRETIKVRSAGKKIKRGIYRDFPTRYRDQLGNRYVVDFKVKKILRDGKPEAFHIKNLSNGKRVYIGKKSVILPPGEYTYTITYETNRQLGFFKDHDELYWNVTGNGWGFPIEEASATVDLPAGITGEQVTLEGYTGPQGAKGKDFMSFFSQARKPAFRTTKTLGPREGLTIVVSWPKGFVVEPTGEMKFRYFIDDNRGAIFGLVGLLALFCYYIIAWVKVGKDPERGTIIPLYEPPKGFSPAAMRYIIKMGYDHKAFAAALIDMAVKGFLKIRESGGTYTVEKVREGKIDLAPEEKKVANKLLGKRSEIELKQKNHSKIRKTVEALKNSLKGRFEKIYFVTNRKYFIPGVVISLITLIAIGIVSRGLGDGGSILFISVWLTIWSIGVVFLLWAVISMWRNVFRGGGAVHMGAVIFMTAFSIPFVAGECFGFYLLFQKTSSTVVFVIAAIVCINCLFYHFLKAPTRAGRKLLDMVEGFKMYLSVAEKERLNILNPPEKTPELFERYLPYALALDVEQAWAEQFADVLAKAGEEEGAYSPTWYSGSGLSRLGAGNFASSLSGAFSSAISSSSRAPGSSSGGGGGGFSGGGGGGGGGGGW